jgi:hypothetical protein
MKLKKELSFGGKFMLFDYKNFKKKVLADIPKYDKQGFVEMIRKARESELLVIEIWKGEIYLADQYILEHLETFREYDELGACGWNLLIFLTKEAHENYLKRKEEHFVEQLCKIAPLVYIKV